VFALDVSTCPCYGAKRKLIALRNDGSTVLEFVAVLWLPIEPSQRGAGLIASTARKTSQVATPRRRPARAAPQYAAVSRSRAELDAVSIDAENTRFRRSSPLSSALVRSSPLKPVSQATRDLLSRSKASHRSGAGSIASGWLTNCGKCRSNPVLHRALRQFWRRSTPVGCQLPRTGAAQRIPQSCASSIRLLGAAARFPSARRTTVCARRALCGTGSCTAGTVRG
jgi:hypothetical protein